MIQRKAHLSQVVSLLAQFPVVGLIGARQVGKTTLARMIAKQYQGKSSFFDLEHPEDLARLHDPYLALKDLKGLVILDEIQRIPALFEILRVLADRPQNKTRFLVLGSASPDLISKSSESLAGRIAYYTLDGFSLDEVGMKNQNRLWLRGGYPRAYLASKNEESVTWRNNFIQTYLERDVPKLGIQIHSTTLKRFWTMLAHYHGQIWNTSEFARSFGVSDTTIRHYLHLLTSIFVIRQLPAWRENLTKRQVKAPKIYIADSGLFHTLLNISNLEELESHPKLGASWEGFIIQQLLLLLKVREGEYYFWATHAGAELDLLLIRGATRWGFEFKRTTSPTTTRSMHQAYQDLKLDRLDVIHAGDHTYRMAEGIRAVALRSLLKEVEW